MFFSENYRWIKKNWKWWNLRFFFNEFKTKFWFNPYSAGIDFSRQILTSKVDPRTVRVKVPLLAVDP